MSETNQPASDVQPSSVVAKNNMKVFVALGVVAFVLFGTLGVTVYRVYAQRASDNFTMKMANLLHLSAAKIGDTEIPYKDYVEDLRAIHVMRDFDKAQTPPGPGAELTEEQMSDQVLMRLASNVLVEEAAKEQSLAVEDQDIQVLKANLLSKFKDEAELNGELMKRYGWDIAQYEAKVLRPFVLQRKLATKLQEPVKAEAEKTLEAVKTGGDFAEFAKKYNPDSTKNTGGDLGWFAKGDMVPEFDKAVFSLKKGEVYPTLVETQFGYHIIRLDDKKTARVKNDKGVMENQEQVRASHILFAFVDLNNYLDTKMKEAKPKLRLKVHNPFAAATQAAEATETTTK